MAIRAPDGANKGLTIRVLLLSVIVNLYTNGFDQGRSGGGNDGQVWAAEGGNRIRSTC